MNTDNIDDFFVNAGNAPGGEFPDAGKANLSPEPDPVSDCCAAPLYAAVVKIGADGEYHPEGVLTNVKKCMACNKIEVYLGEKKPFAVVDQDSADWLLGKLADIRAAQERIRANADIRIAELEADYKRLYGRYGQELESWAKGESIERRRKTVTLLNGAVGFTAHKEKIAVGDLVTAKQTALLICPEAITTETPAPVEKLDSKLLIARAKELMAQETDESKRTLPPGLVTIPATETISLKLGAKSKEGDAAPVTEE